MNKNELTWVTPGPHLPTSTPPPRPPVLRLERTSWRLWQALTYLGL